MVIHISPEYSGMTPKRSSGRDSVWCYAICFCLHYGVMQSFCPDDSSVYRFLKYLFRIFSVSSRFFLSRLAKSSDPKCLQSDFLLFSLNLLFRNVCFFRLSAFQIQLWIVSAVFLICSSIASVLLLLRVPRIPFSEITGNSAWNLFFAFEDLFTFCCFLFLPADS